MALAFFGVLSFVLAAAGGVPSPLSRTVLGGFTVFWLWRLFVQLFVYEAQLWLGNAFNTAVHVMLTAFWTYPTPVYGVALWMQIRGW